MTDSSNSDTETQRPAPTVKKYLYHIPWSNAAELLVVILTIVGAVVFVVCINGKQQWPTSVHVGSVRGREISMSLITLSIAHSIISFLIGLAVKGGITMAWRRQTLVGGTVKSLDQDYRFGTSVKNPATYQSTRYKKSLSHIPAQQRHPDPIKAGDLNTIPTQLPLGSEVFSVFFSDVPSVADADNSTVQMQMQLEVSYTSLQQLNDTNADGTVISMNCNGTKTTHSCTFPPALIKYFLIINTQQANGSSQAALYRSYFKLGPFLNSNVTPLTTDVYNIIAATCLNATDEEFVKIGQNCAVQFCNPTSDIIRALNEMAEAFNTPVLQH
ncbi:hypothetical protein BKA65DRAFT_559472 [Rhexocercosporidium sp. MPI-PUGE-AT-0058]|nr:hypothetical protein BKA65DRAFT_559472 [Rhexocercosporidium sp. MPI-PUGE-AT-0058]